MSQTLARMYAHALLRIERDGLSTDDLVNIVGGSAAHVRSTMERIGAVQRKGIWLLPNTSHRIYAALRVDGEMEPAELAKRINRNVGTVYQHAARLVASGRLEQVWHGPGAGNYTTLRVAA